MKRKILVFGSGGHAKVVIDIIEKQGLFSIAGVVEHVLPERKELFGHPILLETVELLTKVPRGIVAIGDNWSRSKVVGNILKKIPNFEFPTVVHPSSAISRNVVLGKGTMVCAGAVINADAIVGDHCIINTSSSLDHDCRMGNFSSLAPGVTVGGTVKIGDYTAIALGAKVVHSLSIGEHTVIGAGGVVVTDVPSNSFAMGVPCKVVRSRQAGERYL